MKFEGSTLNFTYDASGTPLTMSIDDTVYYYVTNLQGDVVKLLDSAGNTVAAYSYDAWGVCTGQTLSFVELYNPLRYRGYVYDVETGLYYLQSRYYDPEVGRFLNADVFYSTGQGFVGNNMFAYCGNTPVSNYDPTGNYYAKAEDRITTGCSGRGGAPASTVRPNSPDLAPQPNPEPNGFIGFINFITNTDEQAVLEEEHLAFYKGKLIVKTSGNSGFSCGIIFIGNDVNSTSVVRHEYGHTQQLEALGLTTYLSTVVLPSTVCFHLTQAGVLPHENYYNYPWEYKADQFGDVTRDYASWSYIVSNIYWQMSRGIARSLP